jgi:hypothetical protein
LPLSEFPVCIIPSSGFNFCEELSSRIIRYPISGQVRKCEALVSCELSNDCPDSDILGCTARFFSSLFADRNALIAEELFLRRQLELDQERKAAKLSMVVLGRFFGWAPALAISKPRNVPSLAPRRISTALALEVPPYGSAAAAPGFAISYPDNGRRESQSGRRTHRQ